MWNDQEGILWIETSTYNMIWAVEGDFILSKGFKMGKIHTILFTNILETICSCDKSVWSTNQDFCEEFGLMMDQGFWDVYG